MNKEKINKRYSFIFIVRSFVRSFVNFQKKINKQRLLIPTLTLVSCDKAFQNPCHSAKREQKYVQQHIRICTHGVKTGLG